MTNTASRLKQLLEHKDISEIDTKVLEDALTSIKAVNITDPSCGLIIDELFRRDHQLEVEEKFNKPSQEEDLFNSFFSWNEAEKEYAELAEQYKKAPKTGCEPFDDKIIFLPTKMVLLAASTGQGKTALSLNIAVAMANAGQRVMLFSLEEKLNIVQRINTISNGEFKKENLSIYSPIKSDSIDDIEMAFETSFKDGGFDFFVLDHLHHLSKSKDDTTQLEAMESKIYRLNDLMHKYKVSGLVLSQLRKTQLFGRDGEKKRVDPELEDLKGTDALAQTPRAVMFIHRQKIDSDEREYEEAGKLFIRKNSVNGKTGSLNFHLDEKTGRCGFSKENQATKMFFPLNDF